jgi:hypothetical protein
VGTKLEPVAVTADGHELAGDSQRIKAAIAELDALTRRRLRSTSNSAFGILRVLAPKVRGAGVGSP